ncbi:MAG: hypothetical protein ACKOWF_18190 [Chloroflexota bacterium]
MNGATFDHITRNTGRRIGRRAAALSLAGIAASLAGAGVGAGVGAAAGRRGERDERGDPGMAGGAEGPVESERKGDTGGGNGKNGKGRGNTCAAAGKRCKRSSECCGGRCAGTGKSRTCTGGGDSGKPGNPGNPGGPGACVPRCDGRTCGPDGCGGSCGACAAGATCCNGICAVGDWTQTGTIQTGEALMAVTGDGASMVAVGRTADRRHSLYTFVRAGDAPDAWDVIGGPVPVPTVYALHLSMDGLTLWLATEEGTVSTPAWRLWVLTRASRDTADWRIQAILQSQVAMHAIASNADGTLMLLVHRSDNGVTAYRRASAASATWSHDLPFPGGFDDPRDVRLSADGSTALITEANGLAVVWRRGISQWFRAGTISVEASVEQAALSADGTAAWLVSREEVSTWELSAEAIPVWRRTGTFGVGELVFAVRIQVTTAGDTAWVYDDARGLVQAYQFERPACR